MKEINDLNIPDNLKYAQSHEWALLDGDVIVVGISDYAQDQLGDVVFVELPDVGKQLGKNDELGTVESVKAVSELYSPVSGEVVAVNESLADNPALVNNSPYLDGWMIKIKPLSTDEYNALMDSKTYFAGLKGE